jgi:squalene cyclase
MSVYQKQTLPVQFLQFGVDARGVIVPILRRGKDSFVKPTTNRPAERKTKGASESR